jgi:gluconate:H+ symporter, GntP family
MLSVATLVSVHGGAVEGSFLAPPVAPHELGDSRCVLSAIVGFALIVTLIIWPKLHPFVSLLIGSLVIGTLAGLGPSAAVTSFSGGFGSTMADVGILVGLGAMFGTLLARSGGADRIVDTLIARSSPRASTMAVIGSLIGLPMFFEVGLVLLIPVILLVARRTEIRLMRIAIPTLAGLSAMHGLVPPHPGPLVAISALNANLGRTLLLGILVAIPTVFVAGPLFSKLAARWVDLALPATGVGAEPAVGQDPEETANRRRPSFIASVSCVLFPIVLMLVRAIADIVAPSSEAMVKSLIDFLGTPTIALAFALLIGMVVLGVGSAMSLRAVNEAVGSALPGIAGILLVVGAGGGLKGVLVDSGIGTTIASFVQGSTVPVLVLAWLVAVMIRVATGSATVSTVTAAGILAPAAAALPPNKVSLMVLAIGAGSLFLSHVNDAAFWLVKEFMGLGLGQNLKTWTLMECIISVIALACVMLLSIIV